jgi:hypothetical protein
MAYLVGENTGAIDSESSDIFSQNGIIEIDFQARIERCSNIESNQGVVYYRVIEELLEEQRADFFKEGKSIPLNELLYELTEAQIEVLTTCADFPHLTIQEIFSIDSSRTVTSARSLIKEIKYKMEDIGWGTSLSFQDLITMFNINRGYHIQLLNNAYINMNGFTNLLPHHAQFIANLIMTSSLPLTKLGEVNGVFRSVHTMREYPGQILMNIGYDIGDHSKDKYSFREFLKILFNTASEQ